MGLSRLSRTMERDSLERRLLLQGFPVDQAGEVPSIAPPPCGPAPGPVEIGLGGLVPMLLQAGAQPELRIVVHPTDDRIAVLACLGQIQVPIQLDAGGVRELIGHLTTAMEKAEANARPAAAGSPETAA